MATREKWNLCEETPLPPLLLLSDEVRLPDPAVALAALPAGSGFIFRHYGDPYREDKATALRALAQAHKIFFLVGGDRDLARAVGADGCHMPEHRVDELGPCQHEFRFNTAAAHSAGALQAAAAAGASAGLLSPVFATKSHPDRLPLGAKAASELAAAAPLPVYALGGVNPQTAPDLECCAFAGLAAIEGLIPPAAGSAGNRRDASR